MSALDRERVRHQLQVRHLTVVRTQDLSEGMRRVTLTSPELAGFTAPGPSDHVRVFFPDAEGVLALPTFTPDGPKPPAHGTPIPRDYTPVAFRADALELDLDFVLHGDDGPASAWAAGAQAGMPLAIAGPRGSHLAPAGADAAVLIGDETAFPAILRWLEALGPQVPVTALLAVTDEGLSDYFTPGPNREFRWFTGEDRFAQLEEALRSLEFSDESFAFMAGEAGMIVPLRRYLRREMGLRQDQVDAHGYWKRGTQNLDHHAPLDPSDPD